MSNAQSTDGSLDSLHVVVYADGERHIESHDGIKVAEKVHPGLARQFVAAPELLEALRSLLAECDRHGCFAEVSIDHPMIKPVFDTARAALAKAQDK
jgi:hypothetical protein